MLWQHMTIITQEPRDTQFRIYSSYKEIHYITPSVACYVASIETGVYKGSDNTWVARGHISQLRAVERFWVATVCLEKRNRRRRCQLQTPLF